MSKNVAELLVDVLAYAGVIRMYGVSGDALNGITGAIRNRHDFEIALQTAPTGLVAEDIVLHGRFVDPEEKWSAESCG